MHIDYAELVTLDRRAVEQSIALLDPVTSGDLDRRTPCEGWALSDLVAHMTAQHRGFAAAATGHGADPEPWKIRPPWDRAVEREAVAAALVTDHRKAAAEVLAAFATAEGNPFTMPEIAPRTVPAGMAVGFHLVDYLVHSWDVAVTLGVPMQIDPDVVAAALPIALAVPDGDQRLSPAFPFRPAVPLTGDAGPFARILAALGRDPAWRRS